MTACQINFAHLFYLSGDRPTIFIEIIERVGCLRAKGFDNSHHERIHSIPGTQYACYKRAEPEYAQTCPDVMGEPVPARQGIEVDFEIDKVSEGIHESIHNDMVVIDQAAGCGGFGKGNFSELFKR